MTVLRKEQTPNAGYTKEPGTMTNTGRSAKHNTPKAKQRTQQPPKGKKLDPGKSTAT